MNNKEIIKENEISSIIRRISTFFILTFILIYLFNALRPPSFFHPDEIFQTYEIAHRLVYGYGIQSWEWQIGGVPPALASSSTESFGPIRSLITPLIFGILFLIGDIIGLNYWTEILPLTRVFLLASFLSGLFFASRLHLVNIFLHLETSLEGYYDPLLSQYIYKSK